MEYALFEVNILAIEAKGLTRSEACGCEKAEHRVQRQSPESPFPSPMRSSLEA